MSTQKQQGSTNKDNISSQQGSNLQGGANSSQSKGHDANLGGQNNGQFGPGLSSFTDKNISANMQGTNANSSDKDKNIKGSFKNQHEKKIM
jgi:hypothetical protein